MPNIGGICSTTRQPQSIVMLPCGDVTIAGDAGEGAIEIKAAWRATDRYQRQQRATFSRGTLFTTPARNASQKYNNAVWGLVALHIIHKTKSFPAFVFATWEQVDNYR